MKNKFESVNVLMCSDVLCVHHNSKQKSPGKPKIR